MAGDVGGLGVEVEVVQLECCELRAAQTGAEEQTDDGCIAEILEPVPIAGGQEGRDLLAGQDLRFRPPGRRRARIDAIGDAASSFSATSQPKKRDRAWWRARMVVGRMPRSYSETMKASR